MFLFLFSPQKINNSLPLPAFRPGASEAWFSITTLFYFLLSSLWRVFVLFLQSSYIFALLFEFSLNFLYIRTKRVYQNTLLPTCPEYSYSVLNSLCINFHPPRKFLNSVTSKTSILPNQGSVLSFYLNTGRHKWSFSPC